MFREPEPGPGRIDGHVRAGTGAYFFFFFFFFFFIFRGGDEFAPARAEARLLRQVGEAARSGSIGRGMWGHGHATKAPNAREMGPDPLGRASSSRFQRGPAPVSKSEDSRNFAAAGRQSLLVEESLWKVFGLSQDFPQVFLLVPVFFRGPARASAAARPRGSAPAP